ncbi:MAG: hypothetical protein KGJ06_01475 [Pseudomonadota bacterium]|nr:hypothetical protein [Pseudomonadota bacterium]
MAGKRAQPPERRRHKSPSPPVDQEPPTPEWEDSMIKTPEETRKAMLIRKIREMGY